jgi:hypothetical protein
MNLFIMNMVWNNTKAVVFFNLRQVVLSVILPEGLVTPEDFFFHTVSADERALHDLVQRRTDANVFFFFHREYFLRLALRARVRLMLLKSLLGMVWLSAHCSSSFREKTSLFPYRLQGISPADVSL